MCCRRMSGVSQLFAWPQLSHAHVHLRDLRRRKRITLHGFAEERQVSLIGTSRSTLNRSGYFIAPRRVLHQALGFAFGAEGEGAWVPREMLPTPVRPAESGAPPPFLRSPQACPRNRATLRSAAILALQGRKMQAALLGRIIGASACSAALRLAASARRRAEVCGYAVRCDAFHLVRRFTTLAWRAARCRGRALQRAEVPPGICKLSPQGPPHHGATGCRWRARRNRRSHPEWPVNR